MPIGADGIRHDVVIQLADPACKISSQPEGLGKTVLGGDRLTEDLGIPQNTRAVRIQTGEQGIPAGPA